MIASYHLVLLIIIGPDSILKRQEVQAAFFALDKERALQLQINKNNYGQYSSIRHTFTYTRAVYDAILLLKNLVLSDKRGEVC